MSLPLTTQEAKSRPIIFSPEMVKAILEGRKTQTRRIIKPEWVTESDDDSPIICEWYHPTKIAKDGEEYPGEKVFGFANEDTGRVCPYGAPGDLLWVREAWQTHCDKDHISPSQLPHDSAIQYPATYDGWVSKKRPSIHMPRWASRITLRIESIRVERVQDIGKDGRIAKDVLAEGITREQIEHQQKLFHSDDSPALAFGCLFESINGKGSWASNPWVWVLAFNVMEGGAK